MYIAKGRSSDKAGEAQRDGTCPNPRIQTHSHRKHTLLKDGADEVEDGRRRGIIEVGGERLKSTPIRRLHVRQRLSWGGRCCMGSVVVLDVCLLHQNQNT